MSTVTVYIFQGRNYCAMDAHESPILYHQQQYSHPYDQ